MTTEGNCIGTSLCIDADLTIDRADGWESSISSVPRMHSARAIWVKMTATCSLRATY